MSYAGTYGPSETCKHDTYRPNCWRCNGDVERFAREWPKHRRHAEGVRDGAEVVLRTVVVYDATCPGCQASRTFETEEALNAWWKDHADRAREVATEWNTADDVHAELRDRGLFEKAASDA